MYCTVPCYRNHYGAHTVQSDLAVFVQFGQQRGRRPLVGVSYSLQDGQVRGHSCGDQNKLFA